MKKILLIEDDHDICEVVSDYFNSKCTEVDTVSDGGHALDIIENGLEQYGLVLLDIMLPKADGFTICRNIRKRSDIPVIFITARGREEDMIFGFDMGCDDYIVKPFLLSALYAKCSAIVKRTAGQKEHILACGAIKLDTKQLTCYVDGNEIELTQKECAILKYLLQHKGWVIDRDTLMNAVWGEDYFGIDRVVDTQIKRLRKALGTAKTQIHTVIGRGYKMTE